MKHYCTVILLASLFMACDSQKSPQAVEEMPLLERYHNHSLRNQAFWEPYFKHPLQDRVFVAPPELIEYIALDNQVNGFKDIPKQPVLDDLLKEDIRSALLELPPQVRLLVSHKLAGIFIIEGLGSSGFTEGFYDNDKDAWGGYIVLDTGILNTTANAWTSWKENTPFLEDGHNKISMRIQRANNNDRKHAILYILLHELGHIYAIDRGVHPMWHEDTKKIQDTDMYSFFKESWEVSSEEGKYVTPFDSVFPLREKIVYYTGPKLKGNQMIEVYNELQKTSFVTLYAATNPFDDFAESFATYVHTQLLAKPWSIYIFHDDTIAKQYENPWDHPRMAAKKQFFDKLFSTGQ